MAKNEMTVRRNYEDGKEECRSSESRYNGLEFYYTEKHISEYIKPYSSVIELGCGTGYYAMRFSKKCKEYMGIDITPENIKILNRKAHESGFKNVIGKVGDATKLENIPNECFDVVLCLGPLYHLPPNERELVFAECKRICKNGGIAVFAYINKIGAYAGACVHDELRQNYPNKKANELVLKSNTDDLRPDLFFFTMPEEIEMVAEKYGFSKIKNLGTDFFMTASIVDAMNDEKFELLKPLLDEMASYASCTGMSNHAVLVCRKPRK
ncbi:Uncharacterized methyltransferase ycgJ [uncultured Ruminococcus sp.]|nr:Uncharacterized methyltransferase ycgJ [uncultured Ruminococcus sp.]SCH42198.1 Uncharacterized methyltransferase ycgJ [uncultured Clostridium sp.]